MQTSLFPTIFHYLQHVPKLNDVKSPTDTDTSCVSSDEEKQETNWEIRQKKVSKFIPPPIILKTPTFLYVITGRGEITCLRTSAEERSRHVALRAICSDYCLWTKLTHNDWVIFPMTSILQGFRLEPTNRYLGAKCKWPRSVYPFTNVIINDHRRFG